MHIGFVCHFQPALVAGLLHPGDRPAAQAAGGRPNTPVANLLPALLARGHRLTVFAAEPGAPRPLTLAGPGLTIHLLPHRRSSLLPPLTCYRQERAALAATIRQNPPDVLHAHWTQNGHALAALDTGLPALVTVHDAALTCEWYNRGRRPDRLLVGLQKLLITALVTRRARRLVAVSPYVAEHLRRIFRYRGELQVIPNPVPFEPYAPLRTARSRRFDPARPVFADVSAWGRIKNVDTLLRAFARVRAQIPDARLLLIGTGLQPGGPAQDWATRRRLAAGVEFRGPASHAGVLSQLANEADSLVHLALVESFGMTLCEALALDIPVIAARTGGIPWTLGADAGRLLEKARDPAAAAEAMQRLVQDGAPAPGPAVRQALEARFAPAVVAAQLETLYTLVQERKPA